MKGFLGLYFSLGFVTTIYKAFWGGTGFTRSGVRYRSGAHLARSLVSYPWEYHRRDYLVLRHCRAAIGVLRETIVMKTTWPLLLLLGTLSGCDTPEKHEFMRECKAQGNTAICECAYNNISAKYGKGWESDVRIIQRPDFADDLIQTAVECTSE